MASSVPQARLPAKGAKKKSVRLKHNKEVKCDIFADHRLVDSPRKIILERTQIVIETPLSTHLDNFYNDIAKIPTRRKMAAMAKVKELIDYLNPRVYKLGNSTGLRTLKMELVGSTHDDTQIISANEIAVLYVFERHSCKVDSLQAAYKLMPLKRQQANKQDPWRFGRSEDGTYLSSILVAQKTYEVIERALKLHPSAHLVPFTIEDGKAHITISLKKYLINIIPATYVEREQYHLVARPYTYDENPQSDMMWRMHFWQKETTIINTINMADRGVRLKAFMILKALVKTEHTLHGLTSYQIKTVLLHSFDVDVDQTPRWQRDSVHECFVGLLKELGHFLSTKNLPHFFIRGHNLFSNMPDRLLKNLRARVAYMMSNQNDLIRVVKKRPSKDGPDKHTMESDMYDLL